MNTADPLTLPLKGVSLVEASAGTGKTTALVRTYLHALLTTELTVDKLLVVTFTRAATGELTTRIRAALAEVHAALTGAAKPDEFLEALLENAEADDELLLKRVRAAFTALDDSAVFTIHGFCQRMLADMAFEVGGAFVTEQRDEEQSLREEIAADFWRRRQVEASPAYVRWLQGVFKTPEGLLKQLRDALAVSGNLRVDPDVAAKLLKEAEEAFETAASSAADAWHENADALYEWLLNSDDLNRTKYHKGTTGRLLEEWDAWLKQAPYPLLPKNFERLTLANAEAGLKKGKVPEKTFFKWRLGDALKETAKALTSAWWQDTFASALEYLQQELRRRKRHAREIGFDDMLQDLRDALAGSGGEGLAERIAQRFPLALVDEFQDTDPRQYEIFTRIYKGRKDTGLILIGDPKQAIYKFRGADVFTYMRARDDCEKRGRLFSLASNFRTAAPLIEAINALFGNAEQPAFVYDQIPFVEVKPGREIAPLETGTSDAALTMVWQPASKEAKSGVPGKTEALFAMADVCAEEIQRLLVLGEAGKAHYRDKNGEVVPVRARDVAVLVSMHRQGDAVQQALRERKIASVTLSNDSVFETAEAADFETLLAAVAAPASGSRLRRALATPLLGETAKDIVALGEDELRWSERVAAFREYNRLWPVQGFSAMFAHLLREQRIIERTLARDDGERAMTNLRHLAELAETHAAHHPGIESFMAWLARERAEVHRGDESREMRLESDDELVRIVTIHKAKGLEYPVVFLPFLWDAKKPESVGDNPAVLTHDDDMESVLDLGSPALDRRVEGAVEESRAEYVRLVYVALTRAAHACYVLATPANQCEHSALVKLLGVENPLELEAGLEKWCKAAPGAMTMRAPQRAGRALKSTAERSHGEAREFTHADRLQQRFHVASYSRLAAGAGGAMAERPDWDETVRATPVVEAATGIHAFPAGAASGIFLHALLEHTEFDADSAGIETTVRTQCAEYGFGEQWIETLVSWLQGMLATPMTPAGCMLADIVRAQRRDEMEFYFPIAGLEATSLDEAVSEVAPRIARPALHFADIAGQMKGYIDLVFERDGRYWVIDYKSNR
ncbi:MAG: exodeoxyribonuclease V subunit beta, partial [Gammaproteobacteria bacterium]